MNENQSSLMHHNDICVNHAESLTQIFRDILQIIFSVELKGNSVFTLYTISIYSWEQLELQCFLVESYFVLFLGPRQLFFQINFKIYKLRNFN